jgi:hypothetical protein
MRASRNAFNNTMIPTGHVIIAGRRDERYFILNVNLSRFGRCLETPASGKTFSLRAVDHADVISTVCTRSRVNRCCLECDSSARIDSRISIPGGIPCLVASRGDLRRESSVDTRDTWINDQLVNFPIHVRETPTSRS